MDRVDEVSFEIDEKDLSIMIDVDFEIQKEELNASEDAVRRKPQEIINERINKPDINNFRKFKDNTSSICVKTSEGDYHEREIVAQSYLNHHKRPPKDKAKGLNKFENRYSGVPRKNGNQRIYYRDTTYENSEMISLLHEILQTLDDSQQQLIQEIFFEDKTQVEIAEEQGVSKVAIHNRLKRIYTRLRKEFEERGLTSPFLGD